MSHKYNLTRLKTLENIKAFVEKKGASLITIITIMGVKEGVVLWSHVVGFG